MLASPASALLWLGKAAAQGCSEAALLIGQRIPVDVARQAPDPAFAIGCFRRAGLAGSDAARWQYANWVLDAPMQAQTEYGQAHTLACAWLRDLAEGGMAIAHWRLAQCYREGMLLAIDTAQATRHAHAAAAGGVVEAARWLAERALAGDSQDDPVPLIRPLVPGLLHQAMLTEQEAGMLLAFHDRIVAPGTKAGEDPTEWRLAHDALKRAAQAGLPAAQLRYGLWLARMDITGHRLAGQGSDGNACFKKAAQWLRLAAEHGVAEAWHVLALLYRRAQFSGYDVDESDHCLRRAAELGHAASQHRLGKALWRSRKERPDNDARATYWLWRAAQQGVSEAAAMLDRAAEHRPEPAANRWHALSLRLAAMEPTGELALLAQRVMLANQFDLDKAEMLLIDLPTAQREHCIVVDVRAHLPRARRRIVLIDTITQRKTLLLAIRAFADNPLAAQAEGNYRQRRYRLEKLLALAGVSEDEAHGSRTAAAH